MPPRLANRRPSGPTGGASRPTDGSQLQKRLDTDLVTIQWVTKQRLHAAKVRISEEDHGERQSIYFADPNGVMLEITAPPSEKALARDSQADGVVRRWLERQRRRRSRPRRAR